MQKVGPPVGMHYAGSRSIVATGSQAGKFDTLDFDDAGLTTTSAGWLQYVCETDGYVLCIVSICINTTATTGLLAAQIWSGGSAAADSDAIPLLTGTSAFPRSHVSKILAVSAGTLLEPGFTISTTTGTPVLDNDSRLTFASFMQVG